MDPRLLAFYEQELAFVRDMGGEFAREFPKIAARLDLGNLDVADPYIERLFEGFALLTARIQMKMDEEFPVFTDSLLQIVYPHYLAPIPSMAVVQMQPDPVIRTLPAGVVLAAGTTLRSLLGTADQTNCEFRTAHPVQLLPIEIAEAEYIPTAAAVAALQLPEQRGVRAAIRIRLRTLGDLPFNKVALETLALFMAGPGASRFRLHEQLSADLAGVIVRPAERPIAWQDRLPVESVRALGFAPDEALLPGAPASFDGYRLLEEYFTLPERFLFTSLTELGPSVLRCPGRELEIVLLLSRNDPLLATAFGRDHLALFATPAINLFPRRSDRINLAAGAAEHHIVPDRMRPLDFELFDVQGVEGYAADGGTPMPFLPFYGARDLAGQAPHRGYYLLHRRPRVASAGARGRGPRSGYAGHECFVSLVDAEQRPAGRDLRQLGLDLLCTNRDLALAMPVGKQHTDFTVATGAPVQSIRIVVGPTTPRPSRAGRSAAWRFISHLGLNYLSLTDTDRIRGAAALRELLSLYVPSATSPQARQVEGLSSVASAPIVRRIPGAGPIAAGRGLEIRLQIDEAPFGGAGGLVLASVLDRFFAKYVSINGFTETVLHDRERGEIKRWPIRLGTRAIV